jgi:hypothetical protein
MNKMTPRQNDHKQNKNTETENQYNFSHKCPNKKRQSTSYPTHIEQSNKTKRHPKFNRQPSAPIPNTRKRPTLPRATMKQNKIDKKANPNNSLYSTNEKPWLKQVMQIHSHTNQKVFQVKYRTNPATNQNAPSHRNNLHFTNPNIKNPTTPIDLYNKNENAFTEIAGDNVHVVKRVDTRRRRHRSSQRRRVTRDNDPMSTGDLPTLPPPLCVPTPTSQSNSQRGQHHYSTMRLERHELRRFSKRTLAPVTSINAEHHEHRLRNILDVQSDVLDSINAMTKVHVDKTQECIEILYDLYTDALLFCHRGKHLAPASHPKYHCYYMVFKDLEEIINRIYSKAQRAQKKIQALSCPYCDIPLDYFNSPPPEYNPPSRPRSQSPQSPAFSPTQDDDSSSTSSSEGVPDAPHPRQPSLLTILEDHDSDDIQLQHLDIDKILKATHATLEKLDTKFRLE